MGVKRGGGKEKKKKKKKKKKKQPPPPPPPPQEREREREGGGSLRVLCIIIANHGFESASDDIERIDENHPWVTDDVHV